ncbi:uncharacterized protein J8A68_004928 [[Candida] subhashii]|uniref:Uncharacterized protein n=1 Tax=[Candida] subhashii TaxID=561895 RepID=A0A8J5Q4P4_9ASCO|nr:uncharacterized protein J8A68_004928 [[Candida] subhashii]KAG7661559.1 hypothetical protein J8A68_004928 [[Candida] subhashii]
MRISVSGKTTSLATPLRSNQYVGVGIMMICAKRFQSTQPVINKNSIHVISIPITTSKSYIYCNHRPSMLGKSQTHTVPSIVKMESKLTQLASKGWNKLSHSKKPINVKITKFVKKLLATIPYEENCLRSFPSKQAMIREVNEESIESVNSKINNPAISSNSSSSINTAESSMIQSEIENLKIPTNQLKPIPLFHPSFQKPTTILNQIYSFREETQSRHQKYALLCSIGMVAALPLGLIPLLPNVPAFYLAYRAYCNVKALLGIQHLDYLLETEPKVKQAPVVAKEEAEEISEEGEKEMASDLTVNDTTHLAFKPISQIDEIYVRDNERANLDEFVQREECVIITEGIIESLVNELGLEHLREDLHRALSQETARLNKHIKVEDPVN